MILVTRHAWGMSCDVGARVSPDLYDLGVDRRDPVEAGHADAVVAVAYEVRVSDLVEAHGGQLVSPVVRAVYPSPPSDHALLEGQEGMVEVPVPSDAAGYLLDLDGPHPKVALGPARQGALRLVKREQAIVVIALPAKPGLPATEGSLQEGTMEILVDLFLYANVPDHGSPFPVISHPYCW